MPRSKRARLAGAAVVAIVGLAACGGADGTSPDGDADRGADSLEVTGTDGLRFQPDRLTAAAGAVTVTLTSEPAVNHTFVIEELGDVEVVAAEPGQAATGTVDLEAGTYTFYCSVPGHREAGMEGTMTVTG